MATRYWRNTGTWDASSTANWSDTSGGATGASAPTSADDVIFDDASAAANFTCTIGTGAVCRNLTVNTLVGKTLTFGGSAGLEVHGGLTFPASNVARTYTGTITFKATTTGNTITFNGLSWGNITFDGAGGEWTLGSAITAYTTTSGGSQLTLLQGTFNTGNYNITTYRLMGSSTLAGVRTFNAGSSTYTSSTTLNSNFFTLPLCPDHTQFTMNAGTSTFIFRAVFRGFFQNTNFYNLEIITNVSALNLQFFGSSLDDTTGFAGMSVANNFTLTKGTQGSCAILFNSKLPLCTSTLVSVGGTFASNGYDASGDIRFVTGISSSTSSPEKFILSINTAGNLNGISFYGWNITGSASPITLGTRASDLGMTSGIVTRAPRTSYLVDWTAGTDGWWSSTRWASSSGGTPSASDVPDRYYDTVIIDDNSLNAGSFGFAQYFGCGALDFSNRTTALTLSGSITPIGGSLTLSSAVTTSSFMPVFCNGGSVTTAGKSTSGFQVVNGTVTLQDNLTVASNFVLAVTGGTFDDNGKTISATMMWNYWVTSTYSITPPTNPPFLKCSGTWTFSGTNTSQPHFNYTTGASNTITPLVNAFLVYSGTINFSATSSDIYVGYVKTTGTNKIPKIVKTGATSTLRFYGFNAHFVELSNTAIGPVRFSDGSDNTFDVFSLIGASGNLLTLGTIDSTSAATLRKSTPWLMGVNSTNGGNNTGLTFGSGDGTIDYVTVSYITGAGLAPVTTGNMFLLFN